MTSKNQLATWIIASILTPTIPAILAGIFLEQRVEKKTTTSVPNPPPTVIVVPTVIPPTPQALLDQLAAQRAHTDALKSQLRNLQRETDRRKDFVTKPLREWPTPPEKRRTLGADIPYTADLPSASNLKQTVPSEKVNPTPQPTVVPLYYRVRSQQSHQVEYARIVEVTNHLKSLNIFYTRGRAYKDSWRGPQYVPIGIPPTPSWRPYFAKSEAHRQRIMSKMVALGIEATVEKPEDMND